MREVSGSTWTFQMIILFILIFACFLSLVLSYSKAYTIKNRTLTIIEKYEGVTPESGRVINAFAKQHSYRTVGTCPEDWYGAVDMDGTYEVVKENKKYYYCFNESTAPNTQVYYDIIIFYKFNLPVLGNIATYKIKGQTRTFNGNEERVTK